MHQDKIEISAFLATLGISSVSESYDISIIDFSVALYRSLYIFQDGV